MTLEIDFLPFATGVGAGVESQAAWVSDTVVINGFITGTAQSTQVNKAIRQPSFVAAAISNYMGNVINQNIVDNGNLNSFWSQFWQSLLVGSAFTDVGTTNAIIIEAPFSLSFPAPVVGLRITVKVAATNNGAVTLNWMGNGNLNVTYPDGTALSGSELTSNGFTTLVFDGTNWQLLSLSPNTSLVKGYANRAETLTANYTIVAGDGGKNFNVASNGLFVGISTAYITSGNGPVVVAAYTSSGFTLLTDSGVFVGGNYNILSGKNSVVVPAGGWLAFEPDGSNVRIIAGDPSSIGAPGNLAVQGNLAVVGTATAAAGTSGTQLLNYSQLQGSGAANPWYMLFPNGFLMQGGSNVTPSDGVQTIYLPISYNNTDYTVDLTVSNLATFTYNDDTIQLNPISAASFPVSTGHGSNGTLNGSVAFHWRTAGFIS